MTSLKVLTDIIEKVVERSYIVGQSWSFIKEHLYNDRMQMLNVFNLIEPNYLTNILRTFVIEHCITDVRSSKKNKSQLIASVMKLYYTQSLC